jgi:hypothetical protein
MSKKPCSKSGKQSQAHPFLAQMLFRSLSEASALCEAIAKPNHGVPAIWELRFYQNPARALDLMNQGVERSRIDQLLWDEACREQDTIGIRVHRRMLLCEACARTVIVDHAGEDAAFLAISTAQLTKGALIVATDRRTEKACVLGNVPGTVTERDLFRFLERKNIIDLRPQEQ